MKNLWYLTPMWIVSRISTGSWKNSGTAALKWGSVGFTTGAIAGAAIGAGAGLIKNKKCNLLLQKVALLFVFIISVVSDFP